MKYTAARLLSVSGPKPQLGPQYDDCLPFLHRHPRNRDISESCAHLRRLEGAEPDVLHDYTQ